jgi:hypothetical protein
VLSSELCLGNYLSGGWTLVVLAVTWIVCVQGAAYQVVVECVEPSFNIYIYMEENHETRPSL